MKCEEIKKIIPKYFQHTASEQETKEVEEHLCVCSNCRADLSNLMDRDAQPPKDQVIPERPIEGIQPPPKKDEIP